MGDSDSKTATPEATPGARGWAQRVGLPALGALTLGALAVCVVSGIVVATGFDPGRPAASILSFEVSRPYGWFFRALHAWSAHLSLIGLVAHTIEYVARRSDRQTSAGNWVVLTASLPVVAYLMLGGRALVGDTEAGGVAAVMHGLLSAVPAFGPAAADVLVRATAGGDMHGLPFPLFPPATFCWRSSSSFTSSGWYPMRSRRRSRWGWQAELRWWSDLLWR